MDLKVPHIQTIPLRWKLLHVLLSTSVSMVVLLGIQNATHPAGRSQPSLLILVILAALSGICEYLLITDQSNIFQTTHGRQFQLYALASALIISMLIGFEVLKADLVVFMIIIFMGGLILRSTRYIWIFHYLYAYFFNTFIYDGLQNNPNDGLLFGTLRSILLDQLKLVDHNQFVSLIMAVCIASSTVWVVHTFVDKTLG